MVVNRTLRTLLVLLSLSLAAPLLLAQQTGAISGTVSATDGAVLPGVTVEARSNVLPQPRVSITDENGQYRLPALQPGTYTLTFILAGMQDVSRNVAVQLNQTAEVNVTLGMAGVAEEITVTAEATLVDRQSTELQSTVSEEQLETLPLTQDYRDLQKLIPGVMYTQDTVRGPSAGASGQDNVYMFDGVNVTMPLFGVLNVEPNTRDVAQVTVTRGGATAIDFNRAAGFLIDTVSKSGANDFFGELSYQLMHPDFIADQEGAQNRVFDEERSWITANLGGPVLPDRLYFYASYYRPESRRDNQANLYGELPEFTSERDEYFGKLTWTPTASWLINASYRDSHRLDTSGDAFGAFRAPTTGSGTETELQIGTFETSWIINPNSFATFKYTDYRNPGFGTADFLADVEPNFTVGTQLDINNLANLGRLVVPTPIVGNAAQNAFVAPFVDRYGYVCPPNPAQQNLNCVAGQRTGGGTVGFGQFARDDDSFFRKGGQVGYNLTLGHGNITHDLHLGYQRYTDSEDRFQSSNGWGLITVPAGVGTAGTCPASVCGTATPAFFVAQVSQQGARGVPTIHSEYKSQNIELNDSIRFNNWTFNVGVLMSEDTLYGQGLARAQNFAGYVASPGTKYKMHKWDFGDMIQPRFGATWAYNGTDTVYASYGRYHPAANSDARAASWDRNLVQQLNVYFDANGRLLGIQPNASSSGKWWQKDIKHPRIDEIMVGTGQQLTPTWSARLYGRYREGQDFIEDTNNSARSAFQAPAGIPRDDYVPNLCNGALSTCNPATTIRGAIGSGSTYVIANLDGAFTKYYEATMESSWRGTNTYASGSYTWSHYYGNFDQDNTSFSLANDAAIFIGSSNIGDGAGRQLWDMKYGDLRGDRRHMLKANAGYDLPWRATVGAFGVYQSGQPYQLESVLPYRPLTGSTSDTNRYAEPAGRRRSPAHHQLDLKYTQNVWSFRGATLQLIADIFNVYDKQTGFDYETRIGTLNFTTRTDVPTVEIPESIPASVLAGLNLAPGARINAPYPTRFYAPRRYQFMARVQF